MELYKALLSEQESSRIHSSRKNEVRTDFPIAFQYRIGNHPSETRPSLVELLRIYYAVKVNLLISVFLIRTQIQDTRFIGGGMALTKMEAIESIALFGATGSVLSPFLLLLGVYWLIPNFRHLSIYISGFIFFVFVLSFLTGILGFIMVIRSNGFVSKMPQRAASDFKTAGAMIIVVGFITLLNWVFISSGLLILIAGIECETIWKKIQRARFQTGWPSLTVATAAGSPWSRRLSCRFCGAPLVAESANSQGHLVRVKCHCSLDKTTEVIRLPLSQLESWAPILADRLHRCEQCGDRTIALLVIGQNQLISRLQAYCPNRHSNRTHRIVWTPLYPHIARTPPTEFGVQGTIRQARILPSMQRHYVEPSPLDYQRHQIQVVPQITSVVQPIHLSSSPPQATVQHNYIQFCSNCGVRIESSDRFCYRCGSQIQ